MVGEQRENALGGARVGGGGGGLGSGRRRGQGREETVLGGGRAREDGSSERMHRVCVGDVACVVRVCEVDLLSRM